MGKKGGVEKKDLPLWVEQFSPQVIGIQLMSHHLLSLVAASATELELSSKTDLTGRVRDHE